jgi:uncharacterized protein (TIGR00661 family)
MPGHSKRILVAVLDWGLGHATRCVPIIRDLVSRGCTVAISGNGQSLFLLKQEFPQLSFHELESYKVAYSSSLPFMMKVFLQLPKFLRAIRKEHEQVDNLIAQHKFDIVISDNRYGCWSPRVPAVLITHQLNIIMPASMKWMSRSLNYFNHRLINRFDLCWVPDSDHERITGALTVPGKLKVRFVGMLSRFDKSNIQIEDGLILGVVSGPEPQREIFEAILKKEMTRLAGNFTCIIVRGIPSGTASTHSRITFLNHVRGQELGTLIQKAAILITRSGYSTIMDLTRLEKKAVVMVPTPGQTEQEYLAAELDKRKVAVLQHQSEFDLNKAILKVKEYQGFENRDQETNLLRNAIDELLQMKKSR